METHNENLANLLSQIQIDQGKAQQIAQDIHQGDELLARQAAPTVPAGMFERIERAMRTRQQRQERIKMLRRAAAVLILALIPMGIWQWHRVQNIQVVSGPITSQAAGDEAGLFDSEVDLWELALMYGDQDEAIDDLALIEVSLWNEVVWETEDLLGKELDHENYITNIIDFAIGLSLA